jgi:hypothetical protein
MEASRKSSMLFALVPTVFVLFFGSIAGTDFFVWYQLSKKGVVVPGRIAEYHPGKTGYLVVDFTTRTGRHIRTRSNLETWPGRREPGTTAPIRYLPGNPNGPIRRDGTNGSLLIGILWAIPCMVSLAIACVAWLGLFLNGRGRHTRNQGPVDKLY